MLGIMWVKLLIESARAVSFMSVSCLLKLYYRYSFYLAWFSCSVIDAVFSDELY